MGEIRATPVYTVEIEQVRHKYKRGICIKMFIPEGIAKKTQTEAQSRDRSIASDPKLMRLRGTFGHKMR